MFSFHNLFLKNSKNKYPISEKIIAIVKFAIVKISCIAQIKPLFCPDPEWVNSPIKRFV